MNFEKFKKFVIDLYKRESKPEPNYSLMKNAYEYIDLRKDGLIQMNEWLKVFTVVEVRFLSKNIV